MYVFVAWPCMFEDEKETIQISFTGKKLNLHFDVARDCKCASIYLAFNFTESNISYVS